MEESLRQLLDKLLDLFVDLDEDPSEAGLGLHPTDDLDLEVTVGDRFPITAGLPVRPVDGVGDEFPKGHVDVGPVDGTPVQSPASVLRLTAVDRYLTLADLFVLEVIPDPGEVAAVGSTVSPEHLTLT